MSARAISMLVLVSAAVCVARPARACAESPEPLDYFTFDEPLPADGSVGVLRDTAILLRGRGYGIGGSPVISSFFQVEKVALFDAFGRAVALESAPTDWGANSPVAAFVPSAPLAANAEYHLSASIAPTSIERPPEAEGPEAIELAFTTGADVAPELALEGNIEVTLSATSVPNRVCDEPNGCSESNCHPMGERPALNAHVVLPSATGGVDFDGYHGMLYVTNDRAVSFSSLGGTTDSGFIVFLPTSLAFGPGARAELDIELPDEDAAYRPCFSLDVWDPIGLDATAEPVCLELLKPSDFYPITGGAGAGGVGNGGDGGAQSGGGVGGGATGCSCRVAGARDGGLSAWFAVSLVLPWLRRRWRSVATSSRG